MLQERNGIRSGLETHTGPDLTEMQRTKAKVMGRKEGRLCSGFTPGGAVVHNGPARGIHPPALGIILS